MINSSTFERPMQNDKFLTAAQVEHLNSSFAFKICYAFHGSITGNPRTTPSELDYEQVARAVDGLSAERGDILCIEGICAQNLTFEDVFKGIELVQERKGVPVEGRMGRRDVAEFLRAEKGINTFTYAEALAICRGIRTVYTDISAEEFEKPFEGMQLTRLEKCTLWNFEPRLRKARESRVAQLAIAVSLDVRQTKKSAGDEPAVNLLLFGAMHRSTKQSGGLEQYYREMDIKVADIEVPSLQQYEELALRFQLPIGAVTHPFSQG